MHLPDYTEETTSRDQTQPSLEARDQTTDALESSARAETEERSETSELESSERAKSGPAVKPRRKYNKRLLPKTRDEPFGTRKSGRRDQGGGGARGSSVIILIGALLETIGNSSNVDYLEALLSSVWPDQLAEQEQGENY